jgi:SAM-dependent methyltransferase
LNITGPNADQIAFWNNDAGLRWVTLQQRIDAMMAPMTHVLLDRAAPALGEHVLDIGCGYGTTTLALAQRVGVAGSVLGVDISRPMLDLAERRIAGDGLGNVELLQADVSTHDFAPATIDLAFSRMGVMFFDDPVAAFSNIRPALRDGGRLVFVCWRPLAENPHFLVPWEAAREHLAPQPKPAPDAPGMFAFADPDRLRGILGAAGFSDIVITPEDPVMTHGPADAVAAFAMQLGPISRALGESTAEQRARAEAAVLEAMRAHEGPDGVRLTGGVWIVSARSE